MINLSLRGGAAHGLAYSKLIAEIDKKKPKINRLCCCSAGDLMGAFIACGYDYDITKKLLKKIPFDWVMELENTLEKDKNIINRILAAPVVLFFTKTLLFYRMKKLLKKHIKWEYVSKAKRVKDFRTNWIDEDDLAFAVGSKKRFSIFDLIAIMKKKKKIKQTAERIPIKYFAIDGTYEYRHAEGRLVKISDERPPLWKCVFFAIYNPAFKSISWKCRLYNGKKVKFKPIDGGVAENYAGLGQEEPYESLSCLGYPKKVDSLAAYNLNVNPPAVRHKVTTNIPEKEIAFLNFDDAMVEAEFPHPPKMTNIF